jgi:diguanylate cyclase (GGDEF)-like protein/PAS domain S-box-containing protein
LTNDTQALPRVAGEAIEVAELRWSGAEPRTTATRASRSAIIKALNLVADPVFFVRCDLQIVDVNVAAARSSGFRRRELQGRCLSQILRTGGQRLRALVARLHAGHARRNTLRAELSARDGSLSPVSLRLERIDDGDEPLFVAVVQHRQARTTKPSTSPRAGEHDYLTHLPARAAFSARLRLAERRSRRKKRGFAVLFIDVDRFKHVNDTWGHRVGDLVLQAYSQRLLACMRPGDFVARYGGDEFVALVENVEGESEVHRIAERIQNELAAPIEAGGRRICVSASVGVAIGQAMTKADDLVDEADRAMYLAKRRGA